MSRVQTPQMRTLPAKVNPPYPGIPQQPPPGQAQAGGPSMPGFQEQPGTMRQIQGGPGGDIRQPMPAGGQPTPQQLQGMMSGDFANDASRVSGGQGQAGPPVGILPPQQPPAADQPLWGENPAMSTADLGITNYDIWGQPQQQKLQGRMDTMLEGIMPQLAGLGGANLQGVFKNALMSKGAKTFADINRTGQQAQQTFDLQRGGVQRDQRNQLLDILNQMLSGEFNTDLAAQQNQLGMFGQ